MGLVVEEKDGYGAQIIERLLLLIESEMSRSARGGQVGSSN